MSRSGALLLTMSLLGCQPGSDLFVNGYPFRAAINLGSVSFEAHGWGGVGIENRDGRTWRLATVHQVSGAAVQWLPELDEPFPVFTLATVRQIFRPGTQSSLAVVVADPPQLREDTTWDAALQLDFLAQDGARATVDLSLHMVAPAFPCAYPVDPLDFGEVVVGEHATLGYTLHSLRGVPDVATFVPSAGFSDAFALEDQRIVLAPFSERVTHLTFTPPAVGTWESSVSTTSSALCLPRSTRVVGRGIPAPGP